MTLVDFFQTLITGVLVGAPYALMCIGLGLIFGVMRVVNFAQGEFVMLGSYGAFFIATHLGVQAVGGSASVAILAGVLAGPLVFCLAWWLHWALVGRVTGSAHAANDNHSSQVLITLGISLVLQDGGLILFGSSPRSVPNTLATESFEWGELLINKAQVVSFFLSLCVAILMSQWLLRSQSGKALRAAAGNPRAATFIGIDVVHAHRIAFALGAGISAIAGGLIASRQAFTPYVGLEYVMIMYAGVILGGLGSLTGAFIGGLSMALVQQLSTLVLPHQLQTALVFVIFLGLILLRPQGIFGRSVDRI
mgnify:CR=1 FL=1